MRRRSNTKQPHDPHELFLDEGISGPAFISLLARAKIVAHPFQRLLRKNTKTPDSRVIESCSKARYVLVTVDKRMESVWTEEIITHKAQVIWLTDDDGGPMHWASALVCGQPAWIRALLNHQNQPVIIKVSRAGAVTNIAGETELRQRRDQLLTARIVRQKKSRVALKQPA